MLHYTEKDELSKRLELEKKMSLAKSRQIQKYEQELKEMKERDHKGKVTNTVTNTLSPVTVSVVCASY